MMFGVSMKVHLATICMLIARAVTAAELKVTDSDLPRVPATEPDKAVSTIQVRDGFRVERVASEPFVVEAAMFLSIYPETLTLTGLSTPR